MDRLTLHSRYASELAPSVVASCQADHGIDLMFDSWGLNLSDQYWFKPVDIDVDWHDVNYFENGYEEALGETLLGGSALQEPRPPA